MKIGNVIWKPINHPKANHGILSNAATIGLGSFIKENVTIPITRSIAVKNNNRFRTCFLMLSLTIKIGVDNGTRTRNKTLATFYVTITPYPHLVAVDGVEPSFIGYEPTFLPLEETAIYYVYIRRIKRL